MGQSRNVLAYRLLCKNTVDEKIRDLLKEKQKIFDAFADKSSAATAAAEQEIAISEKGIGKIIEEEIERIKAKNPELARKVEQEQRKVNMKSATPRAREAEDGQGRKPTEKRERICPACGKEYAEGSRYCSNCGTKLELKSY